MDDLPVTIPPWLLARFNAIYTDPPHYEASYYGPVNSLLTVYFPAADGFMVKPQARLWQSPTPGGCTSIDSQGQQVGTFDDDGNPDFLVNIGSTHLHRDIPLLIYELKKHGESFSDAVAQIDRYIMWAKDYQRQVAGIKRPIWAVLMIGSKSHTYYLDPASEHINFSNVAINTTGPEIIEILRQIRSWA
jgi:hypothetical protein